MKIKWNGNLQKKKIENLGVLQEVALFSRKLCKFVIFCSELDIPDKDEGDEYSKM